MNNKGTRIKEGNYKRREREIARRESE